MSMVARVVKVRADAFGSSFRITVQRLPSTFPEIAQAGHSLPADIRRALLLWLGPEPVADEYGVIIPRDADIDGTRRASPAPSPDAVRCPCCGRTHEPFPADRLRATLEGK